MKWEKYFGNVKSMVRIQSYSGAAPRHWYRRLGWMVVIWSLSVAALAVVAGGMRLFMRALGMH